MWGRKLCVSTMSQIAWWSYSANRVILFWFFLGILKHDGRRVACVEMCWINWNSVSTCVDVPAGWSHRLRLSGYQLLPAATSCYQEVQKWPGRSRSWNDPSPAEVMWREHSDDHHPHCSQHLRFLGSPGITWSTLSILGLLPGCCRP
jgi:hypothetical protein